MDSVLTDALRNQLRQAREAAKLTRAELGRRLGITENQVFRIESGARSTSIQRAQEWLIECGYNVETIAVGEPERAALLATAVGVLHEADLEPVGRLITAWPTLPLHVRTAILALVTPHTPHTK